MNRTKSKECEELKQGDQSSSVLAHVKRIPRYKLVVTVIGLIGCLIFLGAILFFLYDRSSDTNEYWNIFFALAAFLVCAAFATCLLNARHPDLLFLIIVLSISTFFCWSLSVWQYSWDDGIHYKNASILTAAGERGSFNQAEMDLLTFVDPVTGENVNNIEDHSLAATEARKAALNEDAQIESGMSWQIPFMLTNVPYIPCALVIWICRQFALPFSALFVISKLPCAFLYSLVVFFGMRRLRYGKMLYAVAALIPTSVFLAANYSYSYWTSSLLLFGLASFAGIVQRNDAPKPVEVILMLGAFFLACLPRIVYFPLILICLALPRSRFKRMRNAVIYWAAVLFTCCLTASIFFLPVVSVGLGEGDTRGGTSISPAGQVTFILENPETYASILSNFLTPPFAMEGGVPDTEGHNITSGFLAFGGLPGWLTNYGYLPRPNLAYSVVVLVLLLFTALTDGRRSQKATSVLGTESHGMCDPDTAANSQEMTARGSKVAWALQKVDWEHKVIPAIVSWVACLVTMLLIITYMYMVFTDVGYDGIRGVQRRYMLPFIYPMLAFVSFKRLTLPGKRVPAWIYNTAILLIMAFVLMASWWQVYLVGLN